VQGTDNKMYGAGIIVPGDDRYYMFSFDPSNSDFQVLTSFPNDIGADALGRLVLGEDNIIYFNSKDEGEQGEGSIFSYNIANNQMELIYTYDSTTNFETKSGLCVTSDGKLIGIQSKVDTTIHRQIYQFNPEQNEFDIMETINMSPKPIDGFYPGDFVQLDDGSIIGLTEKGGDTFDPYGGKGVLYKFNPITKDFNKLYNLIDVFPGISTASQLFKTIDNNVLGFYHSWTSKGYYEKSFIYNSQSNQIEIDSSTYLLNHIVQWIQEDSNSLLRANNTNQQLQRYNMSTHEVDNIYSFAGNGWFTNLILMDSENLLFQISRNDSLFLGTLNLLTFDLDIVCDLNRFGNEYSSAEEIRLSFSFVLTNDHTLIGDFEEDVRYGKWNRCYHRIVNFDLSNIEMKTISTYRTEMSRNKYSFIADYSQNGDAFAVNITDRYGYDAGFLKQIEIEYDTMMTLDAFEMPNYIYELDDGEEEFGYRILKKFDKISESNSVLELEESEIQIYYSQERLIIQSKEYINQAQMNIFDMSGRLVYEMVEHDFSRIEKLVHLRTGVYVVQVKTDTKIMSEKILVVE